jgi:hypothetical protein
MSVGVWQPAELGQTPEAVKRSPVQTQTFPERSGGSEGNFAREQICGLVQQLFFSSVAHPVKQLVISSVEPETNVWAICQSVGETLASYIRGTVVAIGKDANTLSDNETSTEEKIDRPERERIFSLRQVATRMSGNFWLLPEIRVVERDGGGSSLSSHLREIRREFDYSIVQGPAAANSYEAITLGQVADGIVLVLSAQRTRKATARKVIEGFRSTQTRLLGTVLSARTFPIPEGIYRRL